jgi:hypothetical protein
MEKDGLDLIYSFCSQVGGYDNQIKATLLHPSTPFYIHTADAMVDMT